MSRGWPRVPQRAEQSRAVAKRRAILSAATELLYSEGLRGVTHRNVAARAGVPVGSIGYYYSNRERLLAMCFDGIAKRRRELVEQMLAGESASADLSDFSVLAELIVRVIAGGEISHVAGLVTATVDVQHESPELNSELIAHWNGIVDAVQSVLDAASYTASSGKQIVRSIVGATVCSMVNEESGDAIVALTEEILREG